LASGSDDGTVKLWRRESGEVLRTLVGYEREMYPVTSVAISPDGHWLADGNEFDTKLWDLRSMQ
jgi:WD40 repeat protein